MYELPPRSKRQRSIARTAVVLVAVTACLDSTTSRSDDSRPAKEPAVDPMIGTAAGQVRDDNVLKMKLVWCPPGIFMMRAGKEAGDAPDLAMVAPQRVILTRGYWLGDGEVTQAEWKRLMATEPWAGDERVEKEDDFPAEFVSWEDAMEFCRKLTASERQAGRLPRGWKYSLPTEAQWERACRAGTETRFSFGDDETELGRFAWFVNNSTDAGAGHASRVLQKKPNAWGLHDMHGNVWEWCRDFYANRVSAGRDPETAAGTLECVVRGGCWFGSAANCASGSRCGISASNRGCGIGFRVALTMNQSAVEKAKLPAPAAR